MKNHINIAFKLQQLVFTKQFSVVALSNLNPKRTLSKRPKCPSGNFELNNHSCNEKSCKLYQKHFKIDSSLENAPS